MIQRFNQVSFAPGVKHYTRDGKLYTGPTHMNNGRLMTGGTHSADSEYLYHEDELKKLEMSAKFDSDEFAKSYKVLNRELPIYEIMIDLNDPDTSVSFNSLVVHPAHEKMFNTFSKQVKYQFNDDEQIITGIAISADTPIYRREEQSNEEYYVVFTPKAIKDIVFDYARRNNFNNVNLEHDETRVVDGIFMVMSYIIDEEKGFTAPERFKDATNGSWLVSYKVTDKEVYEAAKNGVFKGFSVEGVFNLIETGSSMEEEFMSQLYTELKKVSEYIIFFNDYPDAVVNNAKRGIELNEKNGNNCATRVGKLRATTLSKRGNLSLSTIRRMYSYLSRAETYYDPNDTSACGTISFLLWGGLAGKRWAEAKLKAAGILEQ